MSIRVLSTIISTISGLLIILLNKKFNLAECYYDLIDSYIGFIHRHIKIWGKFINKADNKLSHFPWVMDHERRFVNPFKWIAYIIGICFIGLGITNAFISHERLSLVGVFLPILSLVVVFILIAAKKYIERRARREL